MRGDILDLVEQYIDIMFRPKNHKYGISVEQLQKLDGKLPKEIEDYRFWYKKDGWFSLSCSRTDADFMFGAVDLDYNTVDIVKNFINEICSDIELEMMVSSRGVPNASVSE